MISSPQTVGLRPCMTGFIGNRVSRLASAMLAAWGDGEGTRPMARLRFLSCPLLAGAAAGDRAWLPAPACREADRHAHARAGVARRRDGRDRGAGRKFDWCSIGCGEPCLQGIVQGTVVGRLHRAGVILRDPAPTGFMASRPRRRCGSRPRAASPAGWEMVIVLVGLVLALVILIVLKRFRAACQPGDGKALTRGAQYRARSAHHQCRPASASRVASR